MPLFQVNYQDPRKSPAMAAPMAYQQTDALLADMEAQAQGLEMEKQRFDMAKDAALQQAAHWQNMDNLNTRGMDLREQAQTYEMEQARQRNAIMLADMRRRDPEFFKYLESSGALGKDAKDIPWDNAGAQLMLQDFQGQYAYESAQQTHWRMAKMADDLGMGEEFQARIQAGEAPARVYKDVGVLKRAKMDDQSREASRQRIYDRQKAKLDAMADTLEPEVVDQVYDLLDQLTIEGLGREEINDIQDQVRGFIDPKMLRQKLQAQAEENAYLKQQIVQAAGAAGVAGAMVGAGVAGGAKAMPKSRKGARSIAAMDREYLDDRRGGGQAEGVRPMHSLALAVEESLSAPNAMEQQRMVRQWAADNGVAQDADFEQAVADILDSIKRKREQENDPIINAAKGVVDFIGGEQLPPSGGANPGDARKRHSTRFPTKGQR